MKKILGVLLGVAMAAGLTACGGGDDPAKPVVDWETKIVDESISGVVLCGPGQTTVGEKAIDWSYKEHAALKAASLNDLKAVDESLATDLASKNLKGLFMLGDVRIGVGGEAGYKKAGYKADGTLVVGDGALTIKMCQFSTNEETQVTTVSTWMPSPEAYAMSLTPATYQEQIHSETADANGLDHNSDVLVLGGAGIYTAVVAHFGEQQDAHDGAKVNWGLGLIKTEEKTGLQVEALVPETITKLGAIGDFNSWGADVDLVKNSEGVYEGTVEVEADQAFKVRANGAWTYSWGFDALTTAPAETDFVNGDGNIKAVKSGTVKISIKVPEKVSIIASGVISFTVEYVA